MASYRLWLTTLFTRRYPFISGCANFANSQLVKYLSGNTTETVLAKLDTGVLIYAPLSDYVGRAAYFVGDLDRKISMILQRIVKPGDIVIDVGANLGVVTLQLAKLVGKQGTVHAFEPNPVITQLLTRSVQSNNFENVFIHQHALGDREDSLELAIPQGNAGRATLNISHDHSDWHKFHVPVRTLSTIADNLELNSVRLMKIDVEGFEMQVLQGAERWLALYPPQAILFENSDPANEVRSSPIIKLLLNRGYQLFGISKSYFSIKLQFFDPDILESAESHDMLAIHRERGKEIIEMLATEA